MAFQKKSVALSFFFCILLNHLDFGMSAAAGARVEDTVLAPTETKASPGDQTPQLKDDAQICGPLASYGIGMRCVPKDNCPPYNVVEAVHSGIATAASNALNMVAACPEGHTCCGINMQLPAAESLGFGGR